MAKTSILTLAPLTFRAASPPEPAQPVVRANAHHHCVRAAVRRARRRVDRQPGRAAAHDPDTGQCARRDPARWSLRSNRGGLMFEVKGAAARRTCRPAPHLVPRLTITHSMSMIVTNHLSSVEAVRVKDPIRSLPLFPDDHCSTSPPGAVVKAPSSRRNLI